MPDRQLNLRVAQAYAIADALLAEPAANQRAEREEIVRRAAIKPLSRVPAVTFVVAALFGGNPT